MSSSDTPLLTQEGDASSSSPRSSSPSPPSLAPVLQSFPVQSLSFRILRTVLFTIIGVVALPYLFYLFIFRRSVVLNVWEKSKKQNVKETLIYKDATLINKLWSMPVAKAFVKGGLEFQAREGYCASATIRNILKSFSDAENIFLPEPRAAPSVPAKVRR